MARLESWDVIFRPGGWIRAKGTDEDTAVYLRVRDSGEGTPSRLNVHFAAMASEKPISSHVWRYVPFEHIEQHANEKNYRRALDLDPDEFGGGPTLDDLDAYFVDGEGEPWQPAHAVRMQDSGAIRPRAKRKATEPPPLNHPGRRISDEFLRDLATTYLWLVDQGQPPAPEISQQTGAPVATVRRWVAKARERSFLPPGRVGRAG